MAQLVDYEGRMVPPAVARAIRAPWRGQEHLGGRRATQILGYFTEIPRPEAAPGAARAPESKILGNYRW